MKSPSYNQTQFSREEPLIHGQIELPPEEIDQQKLAQEKIESKKKRKKLVMIIGLVLVVIALTTLLIVALQPRQTVSPQAPNQETITPTPEKELTLREEIDQLILEVDKSNRVSRGLVFPPVEDEIKISAQ